LVGEIGINNIEGAFEGFDTREFDGTERRIV